MYSASASISSIPRRTGLARDAFTFRGWGETQRKVRLGKDTQTSRKFDELNTVHVSWSLCSGGFGPATWYCCSTQRARARAHTPDPQATRPRSLWTEVWPTQPAQPHEATAGAQRAAAGVSPGGRPVAPPGLGRLVTVITPVGDQHGIDESIPGVEYHFWADDPSCSSTSTCNPTHLVCMVDDAMQVHIDQAASCRRWYTCRCD